MNERKPAFSELQAAVDFIVRALDSGQHDRLAGACTKEDDDPADRPGYRSFQLQSIEWLANVHRQTPLGSLYTGRAFPSLEPRYKLGGHGQELGHVHVDFVRSSCGWQIEDIWTCR